MSHGIFRYVGVENAKVYLKKYLSFWKKHQLLKEAGK